MQILLYITKLSCKQDSWYQPQQPFYSGGVRYSRYVLESACVASVRDKSVCHSRRKCLRNDVRYSSIESWASDQIDLYFVTRNFIILCFYYFPCTCQISIHLYIYTYYISLLLISGPMVAAGTQVALKKKNCLFEIY